MNGLELLLSQNLERNLTTEEINKAKNLILNSQEYEILCQVISTCKNKTIKYFTGYVCREHALYCLINKI